MNRTLAAIIAVCLAGCGAEPSTEQDERGATSTDELGGAASRLHITVPNPNLQLGQTLEVTVRLLDRAYLPASINWTDRTIELSACPGQLGAFSDTTVVIPRAVVEGGDPVALPVGTLAATSFFFPNVASRFFIKARDVTVYPTAYSTPLKSNITLVVAIGPDGKAGALSDECKSF